jgi:hypothetical protein
MVDYWSLYSIECICSYRLFSPSRFTGQWPLLVTLTMFVSYIYTILVYWRWRGLETWEGRAFSESFQPFRAEPHAFYIYRQYTNIVFIL